MFKNQGTSQIVIRFMLLIGSLTYNVMTFAQEVTEDTPLETAISTPTVFQTHSPTPTTTAPFVSISSTTPTEHPSLTPTALPTSTAITPSPFVPVSTSVPIPTQTPIIIQQIITQIPVIPTSLPVVEEILSQPPTIIPNIPVTTYPSDIFGWTRIESVGLIQVVGSWQLFHNNNASAHAYHQTRTSGGLLRLPFEGEGIRVGFRTQAHGGSFLLKLDDEVLGVFETQSDEPTSHYTREFFIPDGYHVLDIVAMLPTDVSQVIAIDYVDVFNGPPIPITSETSIPATPDSILLTDVQLISVPLQII